MYPNVELEHQIDWSLAMNGSRPSVLFQGGAQPPGADLGIQALDGITEILGVDSAAITVMSNSSGAEVLYASSSLAAELEHLQFLVAEGPSFDAQRSCRPVVEENFAHHDQPRWVAFSPAAAVAGVCAAFSFPLELNNVTIGSLTLFRREPGHLSDEQFLVAFVLARILARTILQLQASAPEGHLALELSRLGDYRVEVDQAVGVVAVRLNVTASEALLRLRTAAFASGRPLLDLAKDVVERGQQIDT